jgi:hypothetical protein
MRHNLLGDPELIKDQGRAASESGETDEDSPDDDGSNFNRN